MLRSSFLIFVLLSLCGGFFRSAVEETLLRAVFREAMGAIHRADTSSGNEMHDRPSQSTSPCLSVERGCQRGREAKHVREDDAFGDNGPVDKRFPDPR